MFQGAYSPRAGRSYLSTDLSQRVVIFLSLEERCMHGGQLFLRAPPVMRGGQGTPTGHSPFRLGLVDEDSPPTACHLGPEGCKLPYP